MEPPVDGLCSRLLTLDEGIRFVCLADMEGNIVGHARRKGLMPLLNPKETKMMVLQSVIRMSTRATLEEKLGDAVYAFAMYEKVKRVTIPLRNSSITHVVLASFDPGVDHEPIVLDKILPELGRLLLHKGYFIGTHSG